MTVTLAGTGRPALADHVRLILDSARDRHVLLSPETVAVLNVTSADILRLCDGRRTVDEIVAELQRHYDAVADHEVHAFLIRMAGKHWVEIANG